MKILNFGSLNIDIVYKVDHMVRPGETISSLSRDVFAGGKGLNQSIAVAKAGGNIYHAGAVGIDDGDYLLETLGSNDVNIENIKKLDYDSTGHAIISVDKNGQNSIILYGGTNKLIDKKFVLEVLSGYSSGDYIILQNEISNLKFIIDQAYEKGLIVVFNPSPLDEAILEIDFNKISYLVLNEIEGKDITGHSNESEIIDGLIEKYPEIKVVLTLGEKGCLYKDKKDSFYQPSFKVEVIDTTAAGDTFTGYFVSSVCKGDSIPKALELASKAAAIAVTRPGAGQSIPELNEVTDYHFK